MAEKKQSIAKSAVLVTSMMLCFKLIAFVKQAVIAYYYGATVDTDAYFIAWGFITGVSEALIKALGISIVAVYTSYRINKGKEEASKLINALIELTFPCFIVLAGLIFATSPVIGKLLAPAYEGDALLKVVVFIKILAPVIIITGFEMIFSSMMDSYKSFFIPRLQSFIYSTLTILACIFLSGIIGVNALVASQYASSVVLIILLTASVMRFHKFFFVKIKEVPEVKRIFITAVPMIIGNSALQINAMVDKAITSGLGEGTTSALYYCHILYECVVNIMIANIGNVMFANFAELVAKDEKQKVKETLTVAINTLICLLLGVTIITIFFAKDIVSIVYFRGEFTYESVVLAASALIGYAIAFIAVAVRDLSVQSMFAFADTKHPMIANIISIAINIIFSIVLSRYIGILGVALATSVATIVGMILDGFFIKTRLAEYRYMANIITFLKCIPAAAVLGAYCFAIYKFVNLGPILRFVIATIPGLLIYLIISYICKVQEIKLLTNKLTARIKGNR